jgi:2-amino-4-hydroxy-6-hydroxymethyldihydropteridine diphosphokinase
MILVAIGANLPTVEGLPPIETCRHAASALGALPGYRVRRLSRWYETAPQPPSGQPPYVNGVALLEGPVEPENLLAALHGIEHDAGRVRGELNAARTLDLDIIAIDDLVRTEAPPLLPHPRAHQRAFVLVPLADVAPDWMHPVLRRPVRDLIQALPPQQIRAI